VLDGQVVDEPDRFDAGGDQVVRVHRDTVDSDRRIVTDRVGDQQFRPDAVGRQSQVVLAERKQPRVLALDRFAGGVDECFGGRLARCDVDPCSSVREWIPFLLSFSFWFSFPIGSPIATVALVFFPFTTGTVVAVAVS